MPLMIYIFARINFYCTVKQIAWLPWGGLGTLLHFSYNNIKHIEWMQMIFSSSVPFKQKNAGNSQAKVKIGCGEF